MILDHYIILNHLEISLLFNIFLTKINQESILFEVFIKLTLI
jgi:hypothetical protein